jgi:RimJ/RimL family protein N-acetyltransferase
MADFDFARLLAPRVILRRFRESDLAPFCRYRSDPRVARYQDWESWSEEEGRQFLERQMTLYPNVPGTWFQLAIELAETGALIGDCGLHTLGDRPGQAEIGFTVSCEHQGKGYATEPVNCLLDYVFGTLGKHRVIAVTDTRNAPAARVLERVGMRREGHFVENIWFSGGWGDEYQYAILEREWRARRATGGASPVATAQIRDRSASGGAIHRDDRGRRPRQ